MKVQPQIKMFAELFLKIFSSTHKKILSHYLFTHVVQTHAVFID